MKTAVVTGFVAESVADLAALSLPTHASYAARMGAEHVVLRERHYPKAEAGWEALQLHPLLATYERIVFLDASCIVRDDCPNLFDLLPAERIALLDEGPSTGRCGTLSKAARDFKYANAPEPNKTYYNSSVMVVSRAQQSLFARPQDELFGFEFADHFNLQILSKDTPITPLSHLYNRLPAHDKQHGDTRLDAFIINYSLLPAGKERSAFVAADLAAWGARAAEPSEVLVNVGGGLGDHASAEPVIRYFIKHAPTGTNVRVASHWPEMFGHLPVPSLKHNSFKPNPKQQMIMTLPGTESPLWYAACFLLCHMVDYHSLAMLRRMLPLQDRHIRLDVEQKDRDSLVEKMRGVDPKKVVAVHAGKSWRTKTFPQSWWQEVVDLLAARGLTVCLVGKRGSDVSGDATGLVNVVCPPNGIDLRDQTSVGEMLALLSEAPVLLTNDSSPVQLAGAFDNWILMVATVKHPDLVFPYRNGSVQHKTKALYKRLLADDMTILPESNGMAVDFEVPDWSPYLPEPDMVAEAVVSALQGKTL